MFKLYPVEQHWCSFADYGAILETVHRLKPATVLEFGPGWSTLALIEGGALDVYALEDDPHYLEINRHRLRKFPSRVRLVLYQWAPVLEVPELDGLDFDLALIDGPRLVANRSTVLRYTAERARSILVPLEEAGNDRQMRRAVEALAKEEGRPLTTWTTGPLAGAFALLGPRPEPRRAA